MQIHRDVKPTNIMLGNDGMPRLADFGLLADVGCEECGADPCYVAPEMAAKNAAGLRPLTDPDASVAELNAEELDSWGLGMTLAQLLDGGRLPRALDATRPENRDEEARLDRVAAFDFAGYVDGLVPGPQHSRLRSFIKRLLDRSPETRMTPEQAQQHQFVRPHLAATQAELAAMAQPGSRWSKLCAEARVMASELELLRLQAEIAARAQRQVAVQGQEQQQVRSECTQHEQQLRQLQQESAVLVARKQDLDAHVARQRAGLQQQQQALAQAQAAADAKLAAEQLHVTAAQQRLAATRASKAAAAAQLQEVLQQQGQASAVQVVLPQLAAIKTGNPAADSAATAAAAVAASPVLRLLLERHALAPATPLPAEAVLLSTPRMSQGEAAPGLASLSSLSSSSGGGISVSSSGTMMGDEGTTAAVGCLAGLWRRAAGKRCLARAQSEAPGARAACKAIVQDAAVAWKKAAARVASAKQRLQSVLRR